MRYIIMCGGTYTKWKTPRQLVEINGEPIVARTIRLLRENGITDIAISSNNPVFEQFGVPVLSHADYYVARAYNDMDGFWCNGFYPSNDPVCYIFGDVVFSPDAIRTIVETETDDIMFFGSKPPFSMQYPKPYIEPFCFKVVDQRHLHEACGLVKQYYEEGRFHRKPIAWELWNVITGGDLNFINYNTYVGINDYTCDIDNPEEIERIRLFVKD